MAAGVDADRLEELAGRLDQVAESLSDVAMDVLREALSSVRRGVGDDEAGGDVVASAKLTEKLVNRARTATEKAARLARQAASGRAAILDGDGDGDGDGP